MRGCLLLVAVFVGAAIVEREVASGLALPFPEVLAATLALAVTLTLGSVQGILQAKRQQEAPQDARATWTDDALVRVEGTLVATAEPVTAPFSERSAVFLDYGAIAPKMADTGATRRRPHWRGSVAVACALDVGGERIPLRGMPPTREWTEQQFRDGPYVSRAATHLASTAWTRQPEIVSFDPAAAISAFAASADAQPGFPRCVMSNEAAATRAKRIWPSDSASAPGSSRSEWSSGVLW